jgi:DNA-binding NtrC family response regulator
MTGVGLLVLVVDDDPTVRRMLEVRLRALGCQVITAATGLEALAAIARAVVLCAGETITAADLALPGTPPPSRPHDPIPAEDGEGFHEQINTYRRQVLVGALRRANGNHTQAAKLLRLNRTYLLRLLQKLHIPEELEDVARRPSQDAETSTPAASFPASHQETELAGSHSP